MNDAPAPARSTAKALAGAGVALALGALAYVISETATAAAWSTPAYSYGGNYISDLGNPRCGPYDGRVVCSPAHEVMNWGFVVQGLLLAYAVLLIGRVLRGRPRVVLLGVGAVTAVGYVLTGAVHSSPDATANGTLWIHYAGATLAILGGNAIAILVGRRHRSLGIPAAVGTAGVVLGAVGIAAALIWLATFGLVPPGIPERIAVYAFVLWQVLAGGFLLHVAQPLRLLLRKPAAENA